MTDDDMKNMAQNMVNGLFDEAKRLVDHAMELADARQYELFVGVFYDYLLLCNAVGIICVGAENGVDINDMRDALLGIGGFLKERSLLPNIDMDESESN